MSKYNRWLLRSRIVLFLGGLLSLGPTVNGLALVYEDPFWRTVHLTGLVILFIEFIDSLGWIGRASIKNAIREENERMRRGE